MELILTLISKLNLLKKVTSPGVSNVVIVRSCSCGGHCNHHKEGQSK